MHAKQGSNWEELGPRARGMPSTWQKTKRLHKHQRFRMYNPLMMDFYLKPAFANTGRRRKGFRTKLSDKKHVSHVKDEAFQLIRDRRKATAQISRVVHESRGSVRVDGAERVFDVAQTHMPHLADHNTAKKVFDLSLDAHAPYKLDYTKNGKYICLAGSKGHLAIARWKDFRLVSEEYLGTVESDVIHDVCFCMNESMVATAQREAVYVYNVKCQETHVLRRSMALPLAVCYLDHHFLLCSIGIKGRLNWFDVSTGQRVTVRDTALGECDTLEANQHTGVLHTAHNNGVVRLWTPTNEKPVASVLCHSNRVRGLAVDYSGRKMATSDCLGNLKVWDLRKYEQCLETYKSHSQISSLCFSQTGLLAFSTGRTAVVWNLKEGYKPTLARGEQFAKETITRQRHLYMEHAMDRTLIADLQFCPYEDVLGIGHSHGFSSVVIPGSGEANYDVFEANPFERVKQRQNRVVYSLLDKVRPDMITLDPQMIAGLPSRNTRVEVTERDRKKRAPKKFARKNVTKSVRTGYKGVLYKRNYKYRHMKDIHHRTEKMKLNLNLLRKHKHTDKRNVALTAKSEITAKLMARKKKFVKGLSQKKRVPDATSRFGRVPQWEKKKEPRVIQSKFGNAPKKIYF